jgi:hypothetical protein
LSLASGELVRVSASVTALKSHEFEHLRDTFVTLVLALHAVELETFTDRVANLRLRVEG